MKKRTKTLLNKKHLREIVWTENEIEVLKMFTAEEILALDDKALKRLGPDVKKLIGKMQIKILGAVNNTTLYWGPSVFWAQKLSPRKKGEKLFHLSSSFIAKI